MRCLMSFSVTPNLIFFPLLSGMTCLCEVKCLQISATASRNGTKAPET